MIVTMSVPAWKQAIIDRRKKQEDEQKKKQAEEEAYLASLPPWKRALFQKREKERRQQQQEKERAAAVSCERSSSFLLRQQQLAQEREQRRTAKHERGRRATPPSDHETNRPTSPSSPPYDGAHHFFSTQQPTRRGSLTALPGVDEIMPPIAEKGANAPIPHSKRSRSMSPSAILDKSPSSPPYDAAHPFFSSTSTQQPSQSSSTRRTSITTLPGVDEITAPIAEKVANAPIPQSTWKERPRSASSSAALEKKVVSSMKKFNDGKPGNNEMPAWKKALLQRRKEKEMMSSEVGQRQVSSPTETGPPASSLPAYRTDSPQETLDDDVALKKDQTDSHVNSKPTSLQRMPSPEDTVTVAQEPSLHLQRKSSPVEQVVPNRSQTPELLPKSTQMKKHRSAPDLTSESLTGKRDRASSLTSTGRSHESNISNKTQREQEHTRPTPKRPAPEAPTSSKTQSKTAATSKVQVHIVPSQKQTRAPSSQPPAQPKPVPEVVNRRASEPPQQSQTIQTEGVTHRAPVYKEVDEWANVPEDDPKFLSLPTWRQMLIKRRRADAAKRMGITTSVDDVPLSNGPVTNTEQKSSQRNPSDSWKMQQKAEGSTSVPNTVSNHEKKNKHSPPNSTSNVRALLDRFNEPSVSVPPPVITVSHPRSPSPSQNRQTGMPPATSSRPAYSSFGVPETRTKTTSLTWTPGEEGMHDESLSDDSSEEEGDYTVTNIDDTSSEEETSYNNRDSTPAVVLLRPPQALPTLNTNKPTVKRERKNSLDSSRPIIKTNSILVDSNRPKKRVSLPYLWLYISTVCLWFKLEQ